MRGTKLLVKLAVELFAHFLGNFGFSHITMNFKVGCFGGPNQKLWIAAACSYGCEFLKFVTEAVPWETLWLFLQDPSELCSQAVRRSTRSTWLSYHFQEAPK